MPEPYLQGWRLSIVTLSILLSMLLVNIEVSVTGTALPSISNDLHGFNQSGWIVAGYMVSYTSTLIIWCKISDIFGRKTTIIFALAIFAAFSGGCGAAQTNTQLIACRVLQGVGAAGCIALPITITYEMVPRHKYPLYGALVSTSNALGSLTGPLIGGGISERSTWRWIFLLNVPAALLAILFFSISLPRHFPHHGQTPHLSSSGHERLRIGTLSRLDFVGAFLLLAASMLLVTVLLGAGNEFAWNSATTIACLTISGLLWSLLVANERLITVKDLPQEPLFPWRFVRNRIWMGTLFVSLFSGVPYNILVVDLPQRFQLVNNMSPLTSGVRLIPFNLLVSLGGILVSMLAAKARTPPIFLMLAGSTMQLLGVLLFAYALPSNGTLPAAIYGYEILLGCGIGFMFGICVLIPPHVVERQDVGVSSGALLQFRIFGGALGLAIGSSIMNNYLARNLSKIISAEDLSKLLHSATSSESFPPNFQQKIKLAFAQSYSLQMKVLVVFAVLQFLAVAILWKSPQIMIVQPKESNKSGRVIEKK
ncbi:MFS general substrate transporter [Viridothelium virens]|uniref:MFS general substrate transporter n=1 Tax=Viridothelium virens TaxID=1048519 RepID=A0A6A6H669_VIRVR|nr:MFS general substrate transporter [Viridothelium virens]